MRSRNITTCRCLSVTPLHVPDIANLLPLGKTPGHVEEYPRELDTTSLPPLLPPLLCSMPHNINFNISQLSLSKVIQSSVVKKHLSNLSTVSSFLSTHSPPYSLDKRTLLPRCPCENSVHGPRGSRMPSTHQNSLQTHPSWRSRRKEGLVNLILWVPILLSQGSLADIEYLRGKSTRKKPLGKRVRLYIQVFRSQASLQRTHLPRARNPKDPLEAARSPGLCLLKLGLSKMS